MAVSESNPFTVSLLSPDQLATLLGALAEFPPQVRQQGQECAASGRVGVIDYDGSTAAARVRGSLDSFAQWEWVGEDWRPLCSCSDGPACAHTYALGRTMLGSTRPAHAGSAASGEPTTRPAPRRQRDSGRAASQSALPEDPLERLRQSRDLRLRQDLLARLLQDGPRSGSSAYQPELESILREADPDLLCWRLAQELSSRGGGWVPPALRGFVHREDLAHRYIVRLRSALARDLTGWGEQRRELAKRSLRVFMRLARGDGQRAVIHTDARISTAKLNEVPRTLSQLAQLRSDVRRGNVSLPADQAVLLEWLVDAQAGGTDSATQPAFGVDPRHGLFGKRLLGLLSRAAGSSAACWSSDCDPQLAALAGVTAGAPIRLDQTPVRLLPACLPAEGGLVVDLAFHWPDGRMRPLSQAVYVDVPAVYGEMDVAFVLAEGAFFKLAEQPPAPLIESFVRTGGLPVAEEERAEVLGELGGRFPHLQTTIVEHTRFYEVRMLVAVDLREDDWMQVRLFGVSGTERWVPGQSLPEGALCFEYGPDETWALLKVAKAQDSGSENGSQPSSQSSSYEALPAADVSSEATPDSSSDPDASEAVVDATPTDVWFVAPQPQCVEASVQWLRLLGAVPGGRRTKSGTQPPWADNEVGWWLNAGRRRLEDFAAAWEARPSEISFFGTERMRRLLTTDLHIAPRLRIQASGMDWFSISAEWEAEGLRLSEDDLTLLRGASTRFVKLSAGWIDRELVHVREESTEILADLGLELGEQDQRVTLWQLAGAQPQSLEALERLGADPATVDAARQLRQRVAEFSGLNEVAVPDELHADLRPYQKRGLDFLAYMTGIGIGAVLADDMGLGKTIQALAWLLYLKETEPTGGPSLVVCPASVVHNWEREAERFAPSLRVLCLGSGQLRHESRRRIAEYDLVITNYALLRLDAEAWREIELRAAILDEAQNIKNPDAVVTQAAHTLRAKHRLALTGTPLENRALDLWSISNFVNPGYLGLRSRFQARFDHPDAPPYLRTLLAAKLRPVMLRRTKRQVATDLPERIEERHDCDLTKEQRQLYLAELRRSRELVDRLSHEPGGIAQNKIHILAALTRLRQICCHPALAGATGDLGSGKFEALFELLEPLLAEGHKVLVFSQFVECLNLLRRELVTRGVGNHLLTGQSTKREQIVDAFQNDPNPCVFLVSLKAGGTGLNLTAASYVILFDPWWNPAVEAQAIDRAHRIGQDRTVIAYRMIATGTIEEKIFQLQQRKAELVRDILGEDGFARALDRDALDFLLQDT